MEKIQKAIPIIESKLGYTFKNKERLILAFIHISYLNENRQVTLSNERLEFLGDSILGMLVSDHLFHTLPQTPEGELSAIRARIIEAKTCASFAAKLQIAPYILLGKGERIEGRGNVSILADLFEALLGAIYLDGGLSAAKAFLFNNFSSEIQELLKKPSGNWRSLLQDYCQKTFQEEPVYEILSSTGPEHKKNFIISIKLGKKVLGQGEGNSIKLASQNAAKNVLEKLQQEKS